eukprot:349770-Chlamydomonas_euryale.AAC.4
MCDHLSLRLAPVKCNLLSRARRRASNICRPGWQSLPIPGWHAPALMPHCTPVNPPSSRPVTPPG